MESGDIKLKQSIVTIALILLFSAYYVTPSSIVCSQTMNEDNTREVPCCITDDRIQQDNTLHTDCGHEETGTFMFTFEKPDSTFQNMITSRGMDLFSAKKDM